jgi:hypothetical protein
MKKLFTILFAIAFAGAVLTAPVAAVENEADGAAKLTAHVPGETDNRAAILRGFLHSYNSPLEDDAGVFVREADRNGLDWKLVAAIAGTESTFGQHIPTDSYNAWGWGVFTGQQSGIGFNDWEDGIVQVSEGLRKNYIDRGAEDVYAIGWIYAANGDSWGSHVQYFIDKIVSYTPDSPEALDVAI